MKNFFYRIWLGIRLALHFVFYGMESANKLMTEQGGKDDGHEGINQTIGGGGVFDDMLEEKVTDEVIELRDKHYRVIKEADTYDPTTIVMQFDENGDPVFSNTNRLKKKTKEFFMKHSPVFNDDDNLIIRTIQDNKHMETEKSLVSINEDGSDLYIPKGLYDYETTLTIGRRDIIPRFYIEKFVTKVCVRQKNEAERALVDMYLPTQASQFGKIDAILISNIYSIWQEHNLKSDITDILSIEWVSDKGWNADDLCLFKYDDVKYIGCNIFDGSFVLTFDCKIVSDGKYIPEKYITKELTEKYENEAPKSKSTDLFAAGRRTEREKKKETIKLENDIIKL